MRISLRRFVEAAKRNNYKFPGVTSLPPSCPFNGAPIGEHYQSGTFLPQGINTNMDLEGEMDFQLQLAAENFLHSLAWCQRRGAETEDLSNTEPCNTVTPPNVQNTTQVHLSCEYPAKNQQKLNFNEKRP